MDMPEQCSIDDLLNDFDFSDMMENEHLLDTSINLQEINGWHETSSPLPQSQDGSDSDSGFSGQSHMTDSFPPLSLGMSRAPIKSEDSDMAFELSPLNDCDLNIRYVDESGGTVTPHGSISRSSAVTPTVNCTINQSNVISHTPINGVKTMLTSKGVKAIIIPTRRTAFASNFSSPTGAVIKSDASSNKHAPSISTTLLRNVVRVSNGSCFAPPTISNNESSTLSTTVPVKFPLCNTNSANQVLHQPRAILSSMNNDCRTLTTGNFTSPHATVHPRISPNSLITNPSSDTPVKIQPKFPISTISTPNGTAQYVCPASVTSSYVESVDYSYAQSDASHHVERLIKKQVKMIKNRQAASLSRQRKKEYLERMEKTLEDLREENNMLRHQNMEWQNRYMELESLLKDHEAKLKEDEANSSNASSQISVDNSNDVSNFGKMAPSKKTSLGLRFSPYSSTVSPNRSARAAFATPSIFLCITGLFLLTWFNPFVSLPSQSPLKDSSISAASFSAGSHHLSRTLLQVSSADSVPSMYNTHQSTDEDNSTRLAQCLKELTFQQQRLNEQPPRDYDIDGDDVSMKNLSRISSELNDILYRHSLESRRAKHLQKKQQVKQSKESRPPIESYKVPSMKDPMLRDPSSSSPPARATISRRPWTTEQPQKLRHTNQLQLFNALWEPQLDHFVPESERENDTMYLVSLGPHHLMYPASADDKNQSRPKMTFVIPTLFGLHDQHRPRGDQLALMRISCEVRNFTVVHIDKWKLPYLYKNNEEPMSADSFQRQRGG